MTFSAYKVAIKLNLVSNVASGMAAITLQAKKLNGEFTGLQGSINKVERQLLSIKRLGLVGGAMAVAGGAGLSLFKGPIQAAMEYERAYMRFKTLNLGDAVNKQADSFARGAQAFGVSSTQLMDTLRETYGFFGDMSIAQAASKKIAELNAANSNLFKGKIGAIDAGVAQSLMRFSDMRGATNSYEDFLRMLNLSQRMVTGSGGAMQFSDLEQFAKRAGTSFKAMSDDGIMMMATVMQEMGGSGAGTGLMSAYQNLVAGRTTKKAMAALQDLGLAKLGYVKHGDIGGNEYKTLQITGMQDAKTLSENFPLWIMKNVIPALEKRGITGTAAQAAVVNDILSNRTGSNLGVTFATQFIQTLRDKKLIERAMGVDQTIGQNKNSTSGQFWDLTARWQDLLIEIGVMVLPTVISATKGLIGILKTVRDFAHEWPNLTRHLVFGFGMLSALVAAGGILALTATAIKGVGLALTLAQGGTLASGLGATALGLKAVGAAAAAFLAVYAGYQIGKSTGAAIDNKIAKGSNYSTSSLRDLLDQSWLGKATGWFGYGQNEALNFKQAPSLISNNEQSGFIRTAADAKAKATINNKIVLPNGKVLAEVVTQEQAREATRPQSGSSAFDGRMHQAWPGMPYTPR